MSLTGEDELDRTLGIAKNAEQAIRIPEEEVRAFVCGESPGKAEGEDIGIENLPGHPDVILRGI